MPPAKDSRFLPEIWALFSLGSLWVLMRFAVRFRLVGLYGLQLDDGFAFLALFCWAVIIAGIHCTYFSYTNIDFKPDEVWALSPKEVKSAEWGSKFYIITLYAYITMVFSLKAIVIILYRRLACGAWQKKILIFTTFLCIAGWIATNLMLSLMCLPYSQRFKVQPLPDNRCTASSSFFIVLSCFNVTTDMLLLAIPIPILWTLRIPLHRRVGIFILLASGMFVMAACIIRVSLTVVPNITVRIIARWGARELSIAMVAVNTAALRPMIRKSFWFPARPSAPRPKNYMFNSVQRAAQRGFMKRRYRGRMLNSTSAGDSTVQRFAHGSECVTVLGEPTSTVTSPKRALQQNPSERRGFTNTSWSFSRGIMGTIQATQASGRVASTAEISGQNQGEIDLEKGEQSRVTCVTENRDSALPNSTSRTRASSASKSAHEGTNS